MPEFELSDAAQQWVIVVLVWVGFGMLVGLLAKALVPGREPVGAVGTLMVGVIGSVAGPLILSLLMEQQSFNPFSPVGFLAAVGGALCALIVYRVAVAVLFVPEGEEGR